RTDRVPELDAAYPVLGGEAGRGLLDEAARVAARRAVDPVRGRLNGAVGVRPRARSPADGRDDGARRDAAVHAAARIDDDVGDHVRELALAAALDACAGAGREADVRVRLAAVGRTEEALRRGRVDLARSGRVGLDREPERAVRDSRRLLPRRPEIGAVEG